MNKLELGLVLGELDQLRQERVDTLATALDQLHPDWFRHIELDRLDLSDSCMCVLGQGVPPYRTPGFYPEKTRAVWLFIQGGGGMAAFTTKTFLPHWITAITTRLEGAQ